MVRFYHLTDEQVLAMPVKRFWMMSEMIDRLHVREQIESINATSVATNGGDPAKEYMANLQSRQGVVSIVEDVFDREGVAALKQLLR